MTNGNLSPSEREFVRETDHVYTLPNFLQVLPLFVAIAVVQFSTDSRVTLLATLPFVDGQLDGLGGFLLAYLVGFAYFLLVRVFQYAFYLSLSPFQKVILAWLSWSWFFYAILIEENLTLAFGGLLVLSLFAARFIGWMIFCYRKIREGMFLNSHNDT